MARLSGHVQAALSATACWKVKQGGLLYRSWKALGADLLHILPKGEMGTSYNFKKRTLKTVEFPHELISKTKTHQAGRDMT